MHRQNTLHPLNGQGLFGKDNNMFTWLGTIIGERMSIKNRDSVAPMWMAAFFGFLVDVFVVYAILLWFRVGS